MTTETVAPKTRARKPAAASAAPDSIVLAFTLEKETKNTRRYSEDGDDNVVGTIYISKRDANGIGNPEKISVTIAPA